MSKKTTKKTIKKIGKKPVTDLEKLVSLKTKYAQIKIEIKAGREKNTNAHKPIKKQIAQLLSKLNNKS